MVGKTMNRSLGIFSLAILLVSTHYGLGFLLGTAEQTMIQGVGGSLYAVSIGLGTLALLTLVRFYWNEVEQIWTLLGNRYGKPVKVGVGLMSWASLIGIEAVQIIAAASILSVAGIPKLASIITLAVLFCILSLLPIGKAIWVFRALLLFNGLALMYALVVLHGLPLYWRSPLEFIPSLHQIPPTKAIGVSLSTVLLVLIDMKCQQFVVQAKNVRTAYLGCAIAALMLITLAFLPAALVIAAENSQILPPDIAGKEVIPYLLAWIGGGADHLWGKVLIAALAVPALGLGSNVLRIQTKTILDLEVIPHAKQNRVGVAAVNSLLALAIALKGGEIIGLILCFYAVYLSAVWIPFIAYLLAHFKIYRFSQTSVRVSLLLSSLSALFTLGVTFVKPEALPFASQELTIMLIGLGVGCLSLLAVQLIEKFLLLFKGYEETQF
jgi:solute:Na+ symporter, SSS family